MLLPRASGGGGGFGFSPASLLGETEEGGRDGKHLVLVLAEKKGLNSGGIRTSNKRLNGGEIRWAGRTRTRTPVWQRELNKQKTGEEKS